MNNQWNYDIAFSRNIGLVSVEDQMVIKKTKISIAGMGGVGGSHLINLVRQGFMRFAIADFDIFEMHNTNRQYGCTQSNLGKNKAVAMAEMAKDINPEIEIEIFPAAISPDNVDKFLKDSEIYIDAIDAFVIDARRLIFKKVIEKKISGMIFAPLGFGSSWVNFSHYGMSFDDYFGFKDEQPFIEKFLRFITGISPAGLHVSYMDPNSIDLKRHRGPSSILGCQISSSVMVAEVLKIILNKKINFAPYYFQFDAYKYKFIQGRLWLGGNNPYMYFKRNIIKKLLKDKLKQFEIDRCTNE